MKSLSSLSEMLCIILFLNTLMLSLLFCTEFKLKFSSYLNSENYSFSVELSRNPLSHNSNILKL